MHYPLLLISNLIDFCWLAFLFYWLFKSFNVKKDTIKRQNIGLRLLMVVFILVVLSCSSQTSINALIVPFTKLSQVIGVALCAFGVGWAIWARRVLDSNWSAYPSIKESHQLVESGPYQYTRHPIYTGAILAFLGTFFATIPTWVGLLIFGFATLVFIFRIPKEESYMTQTFPNEYPAYKQRVRWALIPFIF